MRFINYSEKQFIEAVASSTSYRQVLKKLSLKEAGGNYQTVKNGIKYLSLDVSHFTGQSSNRGKNFGPKRPIEDYLSNKFRISSHSLRLRLLREGYFEHKCYQCNNTEWNQKSIPLELEHIDGDHYNNNLSNLTLLCPNCHAQTQTYRRNKSSLIKDKNHKTKKTTKQSRCLDCDVAISRKSKRCKSCSSVYRQKDKSKRPLKEELINDLKSMSYTAIGRKYNVSDNAVRKWCKFYTISK